MYVILNPVAGSGKVQKVQERIVSSIKKIDPDAEFVKTISPGDATHLSKVGIKKGHTTFIGAGGDGTIHEIINGIQGEKIQLGIVPCGNNNLIAKALRIPMNIDQATGLFSRPHVSAIDIGCIGQKHFIMSTGFGLEVEIASEAMRKQRSLTEKLWKQVKPYLEHVEPMSVKMYVDDTFLVTMNTLSCSIVNATTYHQVNIGMNSFDASDGKLHIIAFSPDKKENLAPKLLSGKVFDLDDVRVTQFKAHKVHILYPEDIPLHADGEILRQTTPIDVTIKPKAQLMITGL